MSERPLSRKTCQDPKACRLREGSWKPVADCGFHPPRGAPYPVPRLPLTPGWSLSCLLPSCHPFYDGEGWFSPNPTDASSLSACLRLSHLGKPRACLPKCPSRMGPWPPVHPARWAPKGEVGHPQSPGMLSAQGFRVSSPRCPTAALGGWGRSHQFLTHFT